MKNKRSMKHFVIHMGMILAALLMLAGCRCAPSPVPVPTVGPPTEHNVAYRMCIQGPRGAPGGPRLPEIDGDVADMGWYGSARYLFKQTGSSVPPTSSAAMQAKRDASNLYLSFEVSGDNSLDNDDLIILGIDPDGNPANYRRLHVFPLTSGTTGSDSDQPPRLVKYWKGYPWGSNISAPGNITDTIKVEYASSANPNSSRWTVEMELPKTAFGILDTNWFGLYVNVIRVNGAITTAVQNSWPTNTPLTGPSPFTPEIGTPDAADWGNATVGQATCNGVSITSSDIETNQTPSNIISLNEDNYFYARPRNTSVSAMGTPVAAISVTATFRLRNSGISTLSPWAPVPVGSPLGTTPPGDIAANGQGLLTLGPWNLVDTGHVGEYSANPSQGSAVDLDSSAADTVFINKSAYKNYTFGTTSSPFKGTFKVSALERKPPEGQDMQVFLLTEHFYNTPLQMRWESELDGTGLQKIDEGKYELTVEPGQEVEISYVAAPPPEVRIPENLFQVPPGTGMLRDPVEVKVNPGDLVTLVASGSIQLRREREGPLGGMVGPQGRSVLQVEPGAEYLLPQQYQPQQALGALVASFDRSFRERPAYVVGEALSIKAPKEGASALYLAINDTQQGYEQQTGEGYHVQAVVTPLEDYHLFTDSILARDPNVENITLPDGANLPKYVVCGHYRTGEYVEIEGTQYELTEDAGCFEVILPVIK